MPAPAAACVERRHPLGGVRIADQHDRGCAGRIAELTDLGLGDRDVGVAPVAVHRREVGAGVAERRVEVGRHRVDARRRLRGRLGDSSAGGTAADGRRPARWRRRVRWSPAARPGRPDSVTLRDEPHSQAAARRVHERPSVADRLFDVAVADLGDDERRRPPRPTASGTPSDRPRQSASSTSAGQCHRYHEYERASEPASPDAGRGRGATGPHVAAQPARPASPASAPAPPYPAHGVAESKTAIAITMATSPTTGATRRTIVGMRPT